MSTRLTAFAVILAAGTALAPDAEAGAFATTGRLFNSVSGNATTSGSAPTYAQALLVPLPALGACTSTGAAPPGTAFSRALADTMFGVFVTATATGTGAAGMEQPFLTPIMPIASAASAELQTSGTYSPGTVTLNGLASFSGGGVMEMAVLDTTGPGPMFLSELQSTHYSVERALAAGYLDASRVLGYWRETDMPNGSSFSFTVDVGSVGIENLGFATLTHAVSAVPAPGALGVAFAGLLLCARRWR